MFKGELLKLRHFILAAILLGCLLGNVSQTYAFTNLFHRSISIGSSVGGANTTHTFSFDFPLPQTVGSIVFQYCTDPIDDIPCVNPNGSNVSSAVLSSQSGETGFAVVNATPNQLIIGRTPAAIGLQLNSYAFSGITNPSDLGPFFVRISAFASSDGSGPLLSFSSVAASINQPLSINAEVPDILYFCAALVIPTDCSDATGDFIELGLLSSKSTKSGTSQFLVGSNAVNGYTVATTGPTMTSGSDQIPGIGVPDVSKIGTSQFGLNLRANTTPSIGANAVGGTGLVTPNYDLPNRYKYQDGDVVAAASGRSVFELYTVSYIINVAASQPAGIYNTTITYLCTAGF